MSPESKASRSSGSEPPTLFGFPIVFTDQLPESSDSEPEIDKGDPDWFCGCGSGEARQCLSDILNAFSSLNSVGMPYVDLRAMSEVQKKLGDAAVDLIL